MADLPLTRISVDKERQVRIRNAVSKTESLAGIARVARQEDVDALTMLLSDPQVSEPIYTLPEQINRSAVAGFIERHLAERERGEGLLMISVDESDVASGYYDIQVWPQWAACELSGAIRGDIQSSGQGGTGAAAAFGWLFEVIGLDRICETSALDNIRTARLLERIGFTYKGEIESKLPGGAPRPSRYWELEKAYWLSNS